MADLHTAEYHEHMAEAVAEAALVGYVSAGDVAMGQLHAMLAVAARLRELPALIAVESDQHATPVGHFLESK